MFPSNAVTDEPPRFWRRSFTVSSPSRSVSLTGLIFTGLWAYANNRPHLLRWRLSQSSYRLGLFRLLLQPVVFAISAGIALWNADVAKYFWMANFVLFFVRAGEAAPAAHSAEA